MALVKIIIGSTRPNRFGPKAAAWIMELTKEHPETTFELIDLKDVDLPFLDEPQTPLAGNYQQEHTKAWAKTIGKADGYVFVTPEYNHTTSPALLNAIDFLAAEWQFKPAAFVSYGAGAGGARAVEHLRPILGTLHMYDLNEHVAFVNYWEQLDDQGVLQPNEAQVTAAHTLLERIGFWAEAMKDPRAKLRA